MGTRAALVTGTVMSVAVTGAWSWSASLTVGPAPLPHFGRSLTADYAGLAAVPTGSAWGLFAAVAAIYALCFLVSGLRARRKGLREAPAEPDLEDTDDVRPAAAYGKAA